MKVFRPGKRALVYRLLQLQLSLFDKYLYGEYKLSRGNMSKMKEKLLVENNFMIFLTIFFLTTFLKNVMKVIDTLLSVIQFLGPNLHLICLLITLPIVCICWIQASILHQLEEHGCKIRHCETINENISLFFTVDIFF